ncbi:MAG: hypothetical protein J6T25_01610 [Bacilli bacterium]|nr:hypothetical protein [Bacilli bacterium]
MTKNKIKDTIEFIGLSYKKEMTKVVLISALLLMVTLVLFLVTKNLIVPIIIGIGDLVLTYFLLSRYNDKKKSLLKNRENELISLISYFDVYIRNNNNVYQSFNLLIPYCSNWMKEKIEDLLTEIDKDKSVQPFVNFADQFTSISIHSLMLSIYQMVDQGENSEQLTHFNLLFDEISKTRNREMIEQKQKSLSNMSTFPLAGAGLITISLTISILSILGDLVNVI